MEKAHETIAYTTKAIGSLFDYISIKWIASAAYIAYSFVLGDNHSKGHIAVLILIIADFITGILAAKLSGDEIKSSKIVSGFWG